MNSDVFLKKLNPHLLAGHITVERPIKKNSIIFCVLSDIIATLSSVSCSTCAVRLSYVHILYDWVKSTRCASAFYVHLVYLY